MKFRASITTIALVAFASACDAQKLCGDAAAETPAPTPTGTPTMTTAAPVATTTAPSTTAPPTTSAPTTNFYIEASNSVTTLDELALGVCYGFSSCWSHATRYEWDAQGPAGTTVSFFTGDQCEESTLGTQQRGDVHGSVLSPDATTYNSFVILPTSSVPTEESITSTRLFCQQH